MTSGLSPSASVNRKPDVAEPQKRRLAFTQDRSAEDIAIERHGALYVSDNECSRHHKLEFSTLISLGHDDRLFRVGSPVTRDLMAIRSGTLAYQDTNKRARAFDLWFGHSSLIRLRNGSA
jgi:hypothetical protein